MSKPWGGVGAWALDAEREEAEEREREAAAGDLAQSFPSLKESSAASASSKQRKKKKRAAVPLAQFVANGGGGGAHSFEPSKGLTTDEMLSLPTAPRERSQDELGHGRLGGGFRTFGAGESNGSLGGGRRGYNGFDDRRSGLPPRGRDMDLPSRADKVDSWEAGKMASVPQQGDGGRRDPYGFGDGSSSMVDGVDNWASAKKPLPSKSSSFGSEFRDPRASSDFNRWGRDREGSMPIEQGRRKLVLDPPKKRDADAPPPPPPPPPREPTKTRPTHFGAARPREEILAEKESENEMKNNSRPTSSHSSRPSSSQSSKQESMSLEEVATNPKPKVNPFGNAKPREVVLEEKGIDWRKVELDLEHRKVERYEERLLKEEISHLKSLAIETDEASKLSAEELSTLQKEIASKEKDLELLARRSDDPVQFNQRQTMNNSRPGSAAGRSDTSSTRPPSQSGMSEGSRSTEFVDRPRPRVATGDECGKTTNGRRGFRSGNDKGFFHGRNSDRSRSSRERW